MASTVVLLERSTMLPVNEQYVLLDHSFQLRQLLLSSVCSAAVRDIR